jgi:hypothetical protein
MLRRKNTGQNVGVVADGKAVAKLVESCRLEV